MSDRDRALKRLKDPDGAALRALAELVVNETTATPLRSIATPRFVAGQIATALEAIARGDTARTWADRQIARQRDHWKDEHRPVRTWMPKEADEPLRKLLARPWTPDKDLTLRILDQPALRRLVGEVLEDSLVRFQKRLKSIDKAGIGAFGARAAKRSRGLFGDMARSIAPELHGVAHNLGGIAENLVGAVTEEIEGALTDRIKEFVAGATSDALATSAKHLADPKYAQGFGELRVAVLDVILDTPVSRVAAEADKLKPEELIDVVVGGLRAALDAPDFVETTEARVAKALDQAGDGTLGAWLDEVGLRAVWTETTTELVHQRLVAVVKTPGFDAWWSTLFTD
jgi:hypothetical protein